MRRLWPDSLFGRLVIILVAGLLAAQALTSTIWYEMRYGQVLEFPTRAVAVHTADLLKLLDLTPADQRAAALETLSHPRFQATLRSRPPEAPAPGIHNDLQGMLEESLHSRYGKTPPMRVAAITLLDGQGKAAEPLAVFTDPRPRGHYRFDVALTDGQWITIDAEESQGGGSTHPGEAFVDYLTRIYALRIAVVVLIALLAVRLVLRPLERLAEAAKALGHDLDSPPLQVSGPMEVRRAATAFNLMQQKLRAGVAERTRFLAAVSHDLRSPITRLRLRAELLTDDALRDKFRTDLADMEEMVTATLNFLHSSEHDTRRQEIDIDSLLQGLQADLAEAGQVVTLQGQARSPFCGHAKSLRRCIVNLLENGLRYGGKVCVQVEDSPEQLRLIIADDGPGIPEALLEQVFEPYYRLDSSRSASSGGVGLGLSIARTVAQAHEGTLLLRNAPAGGLEAELTLPRSKVSKAP